MNFIIYFVLPTAFPFLANGDKTPIIDMIPGIAHLKAATQILYNDKNGADQTFYNVNNDGLFTSQGRSIAQLFKGNVSEAVKIQSKFVSNLEPIVDGTPIIGHVKGVVHHILGDHEQGWNVIKSATSSTGAVIGGVFGGPAGAVAGHLLTDAAITGVESAINKDFKPHGIIDYVSKINKKKPDEHVETVAGLAFDVLGTKISKATKSKITSKLNEHQITVPDVSIVLAEVDITKHNIKPKNNIYRKRLFDVNRNKYDIKLYQSFIRRNKFTPAETEIINKFKTNGEFLHYCESSYFKLLDLDTLIDKLEYLDSETASLISRNDFKTVNTMVHKDTCTTCSLAAILDTDVTGVNSIYIRLYNQRDALAELSISDSIMAVKKNGFIDFSSSPEFKSVQEFNNYLKANVDDLKNKGLILNPKMKDGSVGQAAVLKYKIVDNQPEILLINYQVPGLLSPDIPNPHRFVPYIDIDKYASFMIYSINKLYKSFYF